MTEGEARSHALILKVKWQGSPEMVDHQDTLGMAAAAAAVAAGLVQAVYVQVRSSASTIRFISGTYVLASRRSTSLRTAGIRRSTSLGVCKFGG